MTPTAAGIANFLVFGWIAYAALLNAWFPDLYHLSVQEDEYLEWATFWAFTLAALVFVRLVPATVASRSKALHRWFPIALALLCAFVALEEISWAQRLIGYRPPEYFLRENFQQEPNIHNVFDTDLRKLALQSLIAGYGVLLPLLAVVPGISGLFRKAAVVAAPVALVPGFAATLALYVAYPWEYTGEVVELMLGLGFLFAALAAGSTRLTAGTPLAAFAVVVVLGLATAAGGRLIGSGVEAHLLVARTELEALRQDFLAAARPDKARYATRCNLHKRVYTYAEKYRAKFLLDGAWAALVDRGLPEQRAEYFIDPWNVPYWIRDDCDRSTRKRAIFVYSFGPNRKRESTQQEIAGDDIGVYIKR